MLRLIVCACVAFLSGCYACSRHVSTTRPDTVRPCAGISEKYRLTALTMRRPSSGYNQERHDEDEKRIFEAVKKALLKNYPDVFSDTSDATPVVADVDWSTRYQGSPILPSIIVLMVFPTSAEQESTYTVKTSVGTEGAPEYWQEQAYAARFSETWETWLLPMGFIPIPGKSDWSRTFCFLQLQKDHTVFEAQKVMNSEDCIRALVFDPKVDGDVIAATIVRAINRHHNNEKVAEMMLNGGAE